MKVDESVLTTITHVKGLKIRNTMLETLEDVVAGMGKQAKLGEPYEGPTDLVVSGVEVRQGAGPSDATVTINHRQRADIKAASTEVEA